MKLSIVEEASLIFLSSGSWQPNNLEQIEI